MASYMELRGLFSNSDLLNKVEVATIIAANGLLSVTPTTAEKSYAAKVFANSKSEAEKVLMSVLAANAGIDVGAIESATDAAIQTKVDLVIPVLVDALAGV